MIKIENLSYSVPKKDLYNNISFTLENNDHCAFIGTIGSGKSTLTNLIIDPEKYLFDGKLEKDPSCKIGYVSQFYKIDKTETFTVFEYIATEFNFLQKELNFLCDKMETSSELDILLEKYQETLDAFSSIDGNNFESNVDRQLNLANLNHCKNLKISQISGGEFKLVQAIKEMLNKPDLLIMDEPDVFLDFENLNSLKNLINGYKGIILVITHNRYLLNNCFNKIIHLENTLLEEYNGNYIDYNFSLLERKVLLQELAISDTNEIERNEILIDKLRFLATSHSESSRGKALGSRVKIQERLMARRVETPFLNDNSLNIEFSCSEKLEETISIKLTDYNLSFEEPLLEHIDFEIKSNEKVAIIGPNGTGKTNLLREIYNNNNESIKIDENVSFSYLSQLKGETLNESNTIKEELFDIGFNDFESLKAHAANYGFPDDAINQKISSLSGGEKNILQLAIIAYKQSNMLLLDEPTSHLDTYSQIALEKAIKNYNGGILMVSHDFYTISNCMDYVLIIENKSIRKMNMKKFRKMIYTKHFNKDYLVLEQKKKAIETEIESALAASDFEKAKLLCVDLEEIIKLF